MDEIDLYFKAFNGTNEICKIVSNYANKIVDELKKTERKLLDASKSKYSYMRMRDTELARQKNN